MNRNIIYWLIGVLLSGLSGEARAQLVAVDDIFSVPFAQQLVVEAPGVLDNDSYNDEPAEDAGATAVRRSIWAARQTVFNSTG
jgi:hypothetical protein